MEEVILFEPFIDLTNETPLVKEYCEILRKEIIWSHFVDWEADRELAIEHDSGYLGELDDLWFKRMTNEERDRSEELSGAWCHANLGWYEKYDTTKLDFYERYKVENAKLFASENPPKRVSPQEYFAIRKDLTGQE